MDTHETPRSSGLDLGVLDELANGLAEVQSALERIDAGSYGRCEMCGAQIDETTLESSPTSRLCSAHLSFGSGRQDGTPA